MTGRNAAASACRMDGQWRNPALAVGFVLLVLGVGNWLVSASKIAEYTPRASVSSDEDSVVSLEEFPELSARTNRPLLQRLDRGDADYSVADAKLDFYRVVESGGRLLSVAGMLLLTGALARGWIRSVPRAVLGGRSGGN